MHHDNGWGRVVTGASGSTGNGLAAVGGGPAGSTINGWTTITGAAGCGVDTTPADGTRGCDRAVVDPLVAEPVVVDPVVDEPVVDEPTLGAALVGVLLIAGGVPGGAATAGPLAGRAASTGGASLVWTGAGVIGTAFPTRTGVATGVAAIGAKAVVARIVVAGIVVAGIVVATGTPEGADVLGHNVHAATATATIATNATPA